ncbi:hypothetical protein [Nibricoccus sp. IMCC34717]|uniref:hypothetical protein n=1 Tax=Nibricoccus sp. IMCC34717 TaxID=3034021 RepID=UPI003850C16F
MSPTEPPPIPQSAPRVGLLPAPYFFVRVLDVDPAANEADVARQVELAVENWAPFPLAQVYFGHHWKSGARRAVIYAAYRRRFPVEVQDSWAGVEWVAPEFAPLLGFEGRPGQTVVLAGELGVAALHWSEAGQPPSHVLTRPYPEDADEALKASVVEELIRAIGGTKELSELREPPLHSGEPGASSWTFTVGDQSHTCTRAELDRMDIRDREDLAAIRKARVRDLTLWRLFVVSLWIIGGGLLAQAAFFGGTKWERAREQRLTRRAPEIEAINRANELATRIEELATKRLLPFEMIDAVREGKPATVVFRSVTTQNVGQLEINATTTQAADLPQYRAALVANPKVERAEFVDQNSRDRVTSFRLLVTFKANAFDAPAAP